jgi:putative lipoprotein
MIHILALVVGLHFGQEHPGGDRWFGADKAKHFFMAAFVQSATYTSLRAVGLNSDASLGGATTVSAGVSIGKEVHDRRHGGAFSGKDLVWDGAGILAASALVRRAR